MAFVFLMLVFFIDQLGGCLISIAYCPFFIILAGNEDMHKISEEFEFRPDQTTDYGVSCP